MAMTKEQKNARRRELYALKKRTGGTRLPDKRDVIKVSSPLHYPTVKHGPRWGGEGHQVGRIGPDLPPELKRRRKPKAKVTKPLIAKAKAAPGPVKRAAARVQGGVKTRKLRPRKGEPGYTPRKRAAKKA